MASRLTRSQSLAASDNSDLRLTPCYPPSRLIYQLCGLVPSMLRILSPLGPRWKFQLLGKKTRKIGIRPRPSPNHIYAVDLCPEFLFRCLSVIYGLFNGLQHEYGGLLMVGGLVLDVGDADYNRRVSRHVELTSVKSGS